MSDRINIKAILNIMKSLETQVEKLIAQIDTNNRELAELKGENNKLKQDLTLTAINADALEEYGR